MKKTLFVLSFLFASSAFAKTSLFCEVVEYLDENEKVVLSAEKNLDLETGSTYLELGSYNGIVFNATGVNDTSILLYAKVNGITVGSLVRKEGSLDLYSSGHPLSFNCKFK